VLLGASQRYPLNNSSQWRLQRNPILHHNNLAMSSFQATTQHTYRVDTCVQTEDLEGRADPIYRTIRNRPGSEIADPFVLDHLHTIKSCHTSPRSNFQVKRGYCLVE